MKDGPTDGRTEGQNDQYVLHCLLKIILTLLCFVCLFDLRHFLPARANGRPREREADTQNSSVENYGSLTCPVYSTDTRGD